MFSDKVPDSKMLWRYMGFTKFISFLEYGLYLNRADSFEDKYEGSLARTDIETWLGPVIDGKERFIEQERHEEYDKYISYLKNLNSENAEEMRKYVVINCWHMNDYESAAMWKLYNQNSEGIAIQTTYERLKKSISVEQIKKEDPYCSIEVHPVRYIDYTTENTGDFPYYLPPFLCKRKSFEHEQELRIIIANSFAKTMQQEHIYQNGKIISVDYEMLIEKIYIAPTSPGWFKSLIEDVMQNRYGLTGIPIVQSSLDEGAVF